jgi:hypothetical protein
MKPTLGQQVHFYQNGQCYTATIVRVWSHTCVSLFVPPTGSTEPVPGALSADRVASSVQFSDAVHAKDWSWHWPNVEN